jgi:hypothetical protein
MTTTKNAGKVSFLIELNDQATAKLVSLRNTLKELNSLTTGATQGAQAASNIKTDNLASAAKNAEGLSSSVGSLEDTAKKAKKETEKLNETVDDTRKKTKNAKKEAGLFERSLKNIGTSTALVEGPMSGLASRVVSIRQVFSAINPVFAGTFAVLAVGAKTITSAVQAASNLERETLRLEAVLKATGGSANVSAQEIDDMSRAIGDLTLQSAGGVRGAAALVATFKSIEGDTFEQTLRLAADLSEVTGGSLRTSALQLAKALEEPEVGLASLRESGVSFTKAQQEVIKSLSETGDKALAQKIILETLEAQVGGAGGAAGGGLAGAVDLLGENWTELLERVGEKGALDLATDTFNRLAGVVISINDALNDGGTQLTDFTKNVTSQVKALQVQLDGLGTSTEEVKLADIIREEIETLKQRSDQLENDRPGLEVYIDNLNDMQDSLAKLSRSDLNALSRQVESIKFEELSRRAVEALNSVDVVLGEVSESEKQALDERLEQGLISEQQYQQQLLFLRLKGVDAQILAQAREEQLAVVDRLENERKYNEKVTELTNARLKAQSDAVLKTQAVELQAQTKLLEEQFRLGVISSEQLLSAKEDLARQATERQIALIRESIDAELLEEQRRITEINKLVEDETSRDRQSNLVSLEVDAKVLPLLESINRLEIELESNLAGINAQRAQELESVAQLKQELTLANLEVAASLGDLGSTSDLAAAQVKESYRGMLESLVSAFGADSEEVETLNKIIDVKTIEAQFDAAENIASSRVEKLGDIVSRIQQLGEDGATQKNPEVEALNEEFLALSSSASNALQTLQEIALTSGNPELLEQTKQLGDEYNDISKSINGANEATQFWHQTSDELIKDLSESFADGLTDAFFDFADGTKTAADAFKEFASSFLREIAKMILQQAILNALQSGFSGGSGTAAAAADGGFVQGFSTGGRVRGPGSETSDSIPARLSRNEYVIRAKAVKKYGVHAMEALNRGLLPEDFFRHLKGINLQSLPITRPKMNRFNSGGLVSKGNKESTIIVNPTPVEFRNYNVIDIDQISDELYTSNTSVKKLINTLRVNRRSF